MDLFTISVLFLGGVTVYSGYKQFQYEFGGDRNKTTGPVEWTPDKPDSGEVARGVVGFVSDKWKPIVQPDRTRQSLMSGVDPWNNRRLVPPHRPYLTPGQDLLPGGDQQVGSRDPRNLATDDAMITHAKSRPSDWYNPDSGNRLLHPQPISGFLQQDRYSNNAGFKSTFMRYDKKSRHFHERAAQMVPIYQENNTPNPEADQPATSNFWAAYPNTHEGFKQHRGKILRTSEVGNPRVGSRSGQLKTPRNLSVGYVNHRI